MLTPEEIETWTNKYLKQRLSLSEDLQTAIFLDEIDSIKHLQEEISAIDSLLLKLK